MGEEGFVFDSDHAKRLKQAFELTLGFLTVDPSDYDVKKRLARTLIKIAKRYAEDASAEELASVVVNQACNESAPQDRSAWLNTVRQTSPPAIVPGNSCNAFARDAGSLSYRQG